MCSITAQKWINNLRFFYSLNIFVQLCASGVELSSSCLIQELLAFQPNVSLTCYITPLVAPTVGWMYREFHLRLFFNTYQLPSFTTWEAWVPFLVSECEALTNHFGLFFVNSSKISAWAHSFPNLLHLCLTLNHWSFSNITKGTTDPRVEFISQVQTQILTKFHLQNLD